jgi:hypothetical protein
MDSTQKMTTLSEVMEILRVNKKDTEFVMKPEGFTAGKGKYYQPEDLKIIKTYRFEGDSSPSEMCALYVIEANDGLVGYSIDAYGAYSNHDDDGYDDFLRQIPVETTESESLK